jgi:hypothetical protein
MREIEEFDFRDLVGDVTALDMENAQWARLSFTPYDPCMQCHQNSLASRDQFNVPVVGLSYTAASARPSDPITQFMAHHAKMI